MKTLCRQPVRLGISQQTTAQKSDDGWRKISAGEKGQYIDGVGYFTAFFARKAAERFLKVPCAPLKKLERLIRQPVGEGRGSGGPVGKPTKGGVEGMRR